MSQATQAERAPIMDAPRFTGTKRYLNTHEAAEYLSVGHSTLSIHRMNGTGPQTLKWGMNVRYDILELDRWMAGHAVTPTPTAPLTEKRHVGRPRKIAKQEGK